MAEIKLIHKIWTFLVLIFHLECISVQEVCLQGWSYKEKRCYKVYPDRHNWNDARRHCSQFDGGDLAYFDGVEEQHHIEVDIIDDDDDDYWIGLKGNGSHWTWTNDKDISYQSFKDDGSATGTSTDDICVAIKGSVWYQFSCNESLGFICQASTINCDVDNNWMITPSNHCVKVMDIEQHSWNISRDICRINNADLAVFTNEQEVDLVLANKSIITKHWLGLTFSPPGKHTWVNDDMESLNGNRMGRILYKGCGAIMSRTLGDPHLQWFSEKCDKSYRSICQLASCHTNIEKFACGHNTSECILRNLVCDGIQDCLDNSDESSEHCPTQTPITPRDQMSHAQDTIHTVTNYTTPAYVHDLTSSSAVNANDSITTNPHTGKTEVTNVVGSTSTTTSSTASTKIDANYDEITTDPNTQKPEVTTAAGSTATGTTSADIVTTMTSVTVTSDESENNKMNQKYKTCRNKSVEAERRACLSRVIADFDFVHLILNNLLIGGSGKGSHDLQLDMYLDMFDVTLDSRHFYMNNSDLTDWVAVVNNFEAYIKREGESLSTDYFHHNCRNIDSVIRKINQDTLPRVSFMLADRTVHVSIHKISSYANITQDYPVTFSIMILNTSRLFESYQSREVDTVEDLTELRSNGSKTTYIISPILSLSAYTRRRDLQLHHIFTLQHTVRVSDKLAQLINSETSDQFEVICGFISKSAREWSKEGCTVRDTDNDSTTCVCNHTTNFAILMQVTSYKLAYVHEMALNVITYVGCSVSLLTQLMTITVFTCVGTLNSERIYVHRNLCFAIVAAQITFLAGIKAVHIKILCSIVALILHYFYTAVMVWMLVEGLHLYSKVVQVFGTEKSRVIYYCGFGWGVPLVLVTISATADWDGYGTPKSCWLSIRNGTIWAFVGPAIAIIVVNMVILWMVVRVIMKLEKNSEYDQIRAGIKGALFLLPLLGLTWTFGLMAVNEDLIIFQYLFAVFNSLQGFFIFLFHCVCNTEVRQALQRMREKRMLQKGEIVSSISASTSTRSSSLKEQSIKHMTSQRTKYKKNKITVINQQVTTSTSINSTGSSQCLKGDLVLQETSLDDEDDLPLMYI